MRIIRIEPSNLERLRKQIILFVRKHGEGRITHKAIRWLQNLKENNLLEVGTLLLLGVDEQRILGLTAVSDYGRKESIVVVHRDFRQQRVALDLMSQTVAILDKAYGRVALDNIPSLKACFALGMVGFKLVEGPTGKPTLWLGIGNWVRTDVE